MKKITEQDLIDAGYIEGKISFEQAKNNIHDFFDFEKVHKAMIATEWNWHLGIDSMGQENLGIPNLNTIKNHAYALLKNAYDKGGIHSTGGFTAGWDDGSMYLEFTLELATTL